jgi:predicted nucleotidyltransferase
MRSPVVEALISAHHAPNAAKADVEKLLLGLRQRSTLVGVQRVIESLSDHLEARDPGRVFGLYLYGSSVAGGLRPDSDIDLLLLTERSLSPVERRRLVELLLRYSGRRATVAPGRPIELTSLVLADVAPWTYPPLCDFLYGEWLREEFVDGDVPQRHVNPDLAVVLTTVRQHAHCLHGPRPAEILDPVPTRDLHRSMHDSLDELLSDLAGDERNVLLSLARMLVTLDTGRLVPKDEAARQVMHRLHEPHRSILSVAADGYLGRRHDDWSERQEEVEETAHHLARRIRESPSP